MSALDHGMLNIPLHKRGYIDAQIDRYKADAMAAARADAKSRAAQTRTDRIAAKALVKNASPELLARVAARSHTTPARVLAALRSDAHWRPRHVIRALGAV